MMKKLVLSSCLTVALTGCAGMNMQSAFEAGTSLLQAATLSSTEINALGARSAQQLDSQNRVASANSAYTKRVNRLTQQLRSYDGHRLNYKVYINKDMNAFALPNGDIRIYSGLLDQMTDDEVLFVIGHEIGHVVKGHSKSRVRTDLLTTAARQAAVASGNTIASTLSAGEIGAIAHSLVSAQYSQSQEYEADAFGLKVLQEHGKSKAGAVSALRKIAAISGGQASIFSSHPDSAKRADRIERMR